VSDTERRVLSG